MNPFDMVIVVILSYSIIRGAFRGVIREVAAIVGVVGGFYAAFMHHDLLAPLLSGWIENLHYIYIASFLILFCVFFLAATLAGFLLRTLLKLMLLGVIDRVLGAVFGALKAVVLVSLLFFLLITFLPAGGRQMVHESVMAPRINAVAGGVARVIPRDVRQSVAQRMQELKTEWEKNQ